MKSNISPTFFENRTDYQSGIDGCRKWKIEIRKNTFWTVLTTALVVLLDAYAIGVLMWMATGPGVTLWSELFCTTLIGFIVGVCANLVSATRSLLKSKRALVEALDGLEKAYISYMKAIA